MSPPEVEAEAEPETAEAEAEAESVQSLFRQCLVLARRSRLLDLESSYVCLLSWSGWVLDLE